MLVEVDGNKLIEFALGIHWRIKWLQDSVKQWKKHHIDTFDLEHEIKYREKEFAELMTIVPDDIRDYVTHFSEIEANAPF